MNPDEILTLLKIEELTRPHPTLKALNEKALRSLVKANVQAEQDNAKERDEEAKRAAEEEAKRQAEAERRAKAEETKTPAPKPPLAEEPRPPIEPKPTAPGPVTLQPAAPAEPAVPEDVERRV